MNLEKMEQIRAHLLEATDNQELPENIKEAEDRFHATTGEAITCGFCEMGIEAKYTAIGRTGNYIVPVKFIWLPEGLLPRDNACHVCVDCYRVNLGLTEEELDDIMASIEGRVDAGSSLEVAMEDSVLEWCSINLFIAGESVQVKQAVRKQIELKRGGAPAPDAIIDDVDTGESADKRTAFVPEVTSNDGERDSTPPSNVSDDGDVLHL